MMLQQFFCSIVSIINRFLLTRPELQTIPMKIHSLLRQQQLLFNYYHQYHQYQLTLISMFLITNPREARYIIVTIIKFGRKVATLFF